MIKRAAGSITLEEMIIFTMQAHKGQMYGKYLDRQVPYYFHLFRVLLAVPQRSWIVAMGHDLLEDCGVLPDGLSEEDEAAIRILTKSEEETYSEYIQRVKNAPGMAGIKAREVKRADLTTNMDHFPPKEVMDRYRQAYYELEGA